MPAAPIITPGSSYVSSAAVTRSGSIVIDRYQNPAYFTNTNIFRPRAVDFGLETLAIPSNTLPTILLTVGIRAYTDSDIPAPGVTNTCLPAVMVVPIISDGYLGDGKALCNPFIVYPNRVATFTIRAPIEKIAFTVGNGIANDLEPILLPPEPDQCWTQIDYTLSVSQ